MGLTFIAESGRLLSGFHRDNVTLELERHVLLFINLNVYRESETMDVMAFALKEKVKP